MILSEFGSTGIEETSVLQALSVGNGMNPFRSAPRPVFIPPHVPLCAKLSFDRDGKTLMTAAINKIDATLRNRGQTTALFRFVATKNPNYPPRNRFYRETYVDVQHSPAQTRGPHFGQQIGAGRCAPLF